MGKAYEIVNSKLKYCYGKRVLMTSISLEELEIIKTALEKNETINTELKAAIKF